MPFEIVRNDITEMKVDAIVNAANHSLLGGGGVDGAIHCAAGPELKKACRRLGGCKTGQAKITKGYALPCRYVIHTVGPVWQGGSANEKEALASCYLSSLRLAAQYGCESIAFPLISAGAYGYPRDQALKIATDTIRDYLLENEMHVILVVYDRASFAISQKLYAHIQTYIDDNRISLCANLPRENRRECADGVLPLASVRKEAISKKIAVRFIRKKEKEIPSGTTMSSAAEEKEPAASSLEDYLRRMDEGFRDMLFRRIDESGMTDAECYKKANIDRKLFNKIKNQPDYKPSKSTVLAFAVALRLSLAETQDLLMKAGFSLSHSSRFDLIVEYFIINGNYDIFEINEALFSFDQKLLGSIM